MKKTHGKWHHPLYKMWDGMKWRCSSDHPRYGGRGIRICHEWSSSFVAFYEWATVNGWSPGLQIDRIDNNGNYQPSNCRFVTKIENTRNSRVTKLNKDQVLEIFASTEPAKILAARYGVTKESIWGIKRGRTWKNVTAEFNTISS